MAVGIRASGVRLGGTYEILDEPPESIYPAVERAIPAGLVPIQPLRTEVVYDSVMVPATRTIRTEITFSITSRMGLAR